MNVGIMLPLFRNTTRDAVAAAHEAEAAGLHGVFAYDHLWPIGKRNLPALAPFAVLARVLAETSSLIVGPLVARVGLVPDEVLLSQFLSLQALGSGRVVAPLGLGDGLSEAESEADGLLRAPFEERRERLVGLLEELQRHDLPTWVGGSGPKTVAIARAQGAAVNLWSTQVEKVASLAEGGEVTWAGDLPNDEDEMATLLDELAEAGASWVVGTYSTNAAVLGAIARPRPWFSSR